MWDGISVCVCVCCACQQCHSASVYTVVVVIAKPLSYEGMMIQRRKEISAENLPALPGPF